MSLRILLLTLGAAAAVSAQSADNDEVLARGRERILRDIERLPRYTCTQTVERSEFVELTPHARMSCDQIMAMRRNGDSRMEPTRKDRLRLDVEVTDDGIEIFSWPGASRISSERVKDFTGEGLIGTGDFGPFLINIFTGEGVTFWPEGATKDDGVELRQYRFLVPLAASRYRVQAAGETRVVPFEGRFWIDPDTADLRRLMVRTGELSRSTGNCEGTTTVDFARAQICAAEHLLAARSVLEVIRRDAARQVNVTTYAACHEFRGETVVHFGDDAEAAPEGVSPRANTGENKFFPPGIRATIDFAAAIQSATSAAGDLIPARARHTQKKPKTRLLPDGGAPARCRITRLENNLISKRLNVTVACEAVELNGRWVPFAAVADGPAGLLDSTAVKLPAGPGEIHVMTRGRREPGRGATFAFPTGGRDIEVGPFTSAWITTVVEAAPDPGGPAVRPH